MQPHTGGGGEVCGPTCRLSLKVGVANLEDWLLAVCWLECGGASGYKLAAVTAHNTTVVCWGQDLTLLSRLQSEVNCLLYPPPPCHAHSCQPFCSPGMLCSPELCCQVLCAPQL